MTAADFIPATPRVGIQLPEVERVVHWREYANMARAAEESGFGSLWMGDHLLYRGDGRPERGPWEAWTLLAALANETSEIDLGPLVACVGFHPAGVLAKMAATVNEIADGRLVFGVGAGWNQVEYDAFGLPFDRRAARFEESFAVIRRMTRGERVTLDGEFVRVDDVVQIPASRHPVRLMVGSLGERVLRAALPHVDWWNTWFDWIDNSAEGFAVQNARIDAMLADVGRPHEAVKRSACLLVKVDPASNERPTPTEYTAATLDDVADRIGALVEAGADEVILVADPIDERSIHLLGEVLPIRRSPTLRR